MTSFFYIERESLRTGHENIALHPHPQRPTKSSDDYRGVFTPYSTLPGGEVSQSPQTFFLRSAISRQPELFQKETLNLKADIVPLHSEWTGIAVLMVGMS